MNFLEESNQFNSGKLHIVIAPMFAGKSIWISQKLGMMADLGSKTLYINHSYDDRGDENDNIDITSHSSQFRGLSNKIKSIKIKDLGEIDISDYDVIGIDEA